jgi:hypothetical protein
MTNTYVKKFSTSLPIKEMQIKTALDSISPQTEWLSQENSKCRGGVEEEEHLHTVGGNVN